MSAPTITTPRHRPAWLKPVLRTAVALTAAGILWSIWNGQAVRTIKDEANVVPYFASMAVLPAIGMPVSPLFLVAGATFGPRVGLIGSLVAMGLNFALSYWISSSGLRPVLTSLLERRGYVLPDMGEREGGAIRFVMLVKLMPGVPAFVKNYLLGLARVPFWTFFTVSMVFTCVYGAALILLGESLVNHDTTHVIVVGTMVVGLGLGVWLYRRQRPRDGTPAAPDGASPESRHASTETNGNGPP